MRVRLTHKSMNRSAQRLGIVCYTLIFTAAVGGAISHNPYPPLLTASALMAMGVLTTLSWVELVVRPGSALVGRLVYGLCILVTIAQVPLLPTLRGESGFPTLVFLSLLAVGYAAVSFRTWVGRAHALVFGVFYGALHAEFRNVQNGIAEGMILMVLMLGVVELSRLAETVAANIEASSPRQWQLREALARTRRRAFERQRWNGLIHDKVLGALLSASREGTISENSRELATEAVAALRPGSGPGGLRSGLSAVVAAAAERLGLKAIVDIEGDDPPSPVLETLGEATVEALTNVAKHSGQRVVSVQGRLSPAVSTVTVADEGLGFDPGAHSGRRAGISMGIVGRMASIGGAAEVDSRPGEGTRVTLSWHTHETPPTGLETSIVLAAPLRNVLLVTTGMQVLFAWIFRDPIRNDSVLLATMAQCVITTAAVVQNRDRSWVTAVCGLSMILAPIPLVMNLADPTSLDRHYWWGGAYSSAVGILAFRFPTWVVAVITGGMVLTEAVVEAAVLGAPSAAILLWNYITTLVVLILGIGTRRSLDHAAEVLEASAAVEGRGRVQLAEEQEREAVASARRSDLEATAVPLRTRIAEGGVLTDAQCAAMARAEAEVRDRLVADVLLDPSLQAATAEARDRGVRVDLVATGEETPSLAAFRDLLREALATAPRSSRLTAHWAATDRVRGSIVLHGRLGPDAVGRLRGAGGRAAGVLTVTLDADEESVLMECGTPAVSPASVPSR